MKKLIFSILIIFLCLNSFTLISCGGEDDTTTEPPIVTYDITYQLNGGTNSAKNPDTYKTGEIITLDYPEKADYMFAGWFTDSALTNEIKEIKDKEENLTLYAKWIPYEDVFDFVENNSCYEIKIAPNYKVETVIIPSHYKGMPVVKITRTAEKHHKLFESVIISDTVTSIDIQAFSNGMGKDMEMCLEHIEVDENNLNFKSVDGVLYSKDEKTLIRYPANKNGDTFNIPEKVTVIDDFAFSRNENLKSVTIPNSVVSIGDCAFSRAESLECIVIPDSVKKIGGYVFNKCISLKNVTLSNNIESIEYYSFFGCTALESVIIPNSVKSIGVWAFSNCSALKNIVISTNVDKILTGAFNKCTSAESVVIPKSVIQMKGSAFQGCPQLTLYCEAESMPEGWESHLDKNVKCVVWGYKEGKREK